MARQNSKHQTLWMSSIPPATSNVILPPSSEEEHRTTSMPYITTQAYWYYLGKSDLVLSNTAFSATCLLGTSTVSSMKQYYFQKLHLLCQSQQFPPLFQTLFCDICPWGHSDGNLDFFFFYQLHQFKMHVEPQHIFTICSSSKSLFAFPQLHHPV